MTGFVHCNIHGMFRGQTLRLDPIQTVRGLQRSCSLASCAQWTDENCSARYWSYLQWQNASSAALSLEHKPTLTLHGNGSACLVVGEKLVSGSLLLHPMSASSDPDDIHWITVVWMDGASFPAVSLFQLRAVSLCIPSYSVWYDEDDAVCTLQLGVYWSSCADVLQAPLASVV